MPKFRSYRCQTHPSFEIHRARVSRAPDASQRGRTRDPNLHPPPPSSSARSFFERLPRCLACPVFPFIFANNSNLGEQPIPFLPPPPPLSHPPLSKKEWQGERQLCYLINRVAFPRLFFAFAGSDRGGGAGGGGGVISFRNVPREILTSKVSRRRRRRDSKRKMRQNGRGSRERAVDNFLIFLESHWIHPLEQRGEIRAAGKQISFARARVTLISVIPSRSRCPASVQRIINATFLPSLFFLSRYRLISCITARPDLLETRNYQNIAQTRSL